MNPGQIRLQATHVKGLSGSRALRAGRLDLVKVFTFQRLADLDEIARFGARFFIGLRFPRRWTARPAARA
jgi:hypothetical protein